MGRMRGKGCWNIYGGGYCRHIYVEICEQCPDTEGRDGICGVWDGIHGDFAGCGDRWRQEDAGVRLSRTFGSGDICECREKDRAGRSPYEGGCGRCQI